MLPPDSTSDTPEGCHGSRYFTIDSGQDGSAWDFPSIGTAVPSENVARVPDMINIWGKELCRQFNLAMIVGK